jgi:O-antigen/teichoic acid export membrane protein
VFGTDLNLIFGHGFDFPWLLPLLLAIGWFISATLAPLGYVLSMTGRHRLEAAILAGGAVMLVGSLLALIPALQAIGAALSVAITFAAVNVLRAAAVIRIIGKNPVALWHLLPPSLFATTAFLCRRGGLAIHPQGLASLVVQCAIYTMIASILYLVLFANQNEKDALARRLSRRTFVQ